MKRKRSTEKLRELEERNGREKAEDSGAEPPGGRIASLDQDNVDEIGRAVGIEFQDNQELIAPADALSKRDRRRWELDKRSSDEDSL